MRALVKQAAWGATNEQKARGRSHALFANIKGARLYILVIVDRMPAYQSKPRKLKLGTPAVGAFALDEVGPVQDDRSRHALLERAAPRDNLCKG